MARVERIEKEVIKRCGCATWRAQQLLDLGDEFGVTERVLDTEGIEQFLDAFTRILVSHPEIDNTRIDLRISNILATGDLTEVFDIVHGIWIEGLITAEHVWTSVTNGCRICDDCTSDGSISDGGSDEEDLEDVANEVDSANIISGFVYLASKEFRPCKIKQSMEALMFALYELIEPNTFKERARRLLRPEEDDDSETVYDPEEDNGSEMSE